MVKSQVVNKRTPKLVNNLDLHMGGGVTYDPTLNTSDSSAGISIIEHVQQDNAALNDAYIAEMKAKYDHALNTPNESLAAEKIFVLTTGDGSLFQGTPENGIAWLPLSWIQQIENERGTPGALLLKMNEPAMAKNTAGYEGGSTSIHYETGGAAQPPAVTPLPEVQTLPPVTSTTTPAGTTVPVFTTTGTNDPGTGTVTPSVTQTLQSAVGGGKYYWLWYAAAILVIILYLKFRK